MKIYMVGNSGYTSLEGSYKRAFEELGHAVTIYDLEGEFRRFTRFGRVGELVNRYVTIDAWRQKLNRDLALRIRTEQPHLVLVFGDARILFSTLAYVKSLLPCRFVLVWPDPLPGLQTHVLNAAPLYDGVATYCKASVPLFTQMGFANAQWIPLAADPVLHGAEPTGQFEYDLSFVGAWRPERERALTTIVRHFPASRIGIWGTNWHRSEARALRPLLHRKPLLGKDYAAMFAQSRLNLNVIDDTCFPAANMRFFEIPVAGGLQLASACPEMADTFRDQEHVCYAANDEQLCHVMERALGQPGQVAAIRQAGFELVHGAHTYSHRAAQLLHLFS